MTVAITGVNGFIGKNLATKLLDKGYQVLGLGQQEKSDINLNLYIKGSVLENDKIEQLLRDADCVVHLAAITSNKEIMDNPRKAKEINLQGTKNVLEVFRKSKAKKFIFPSTGKVYGEIKYLPIDENHPTKPKNVLGKSKLEVEKLIESYKNMNKQIFIFRIFNVYGPGNQNYLIPTIINQISGKENEITLGDIDAKRDYLYVDDLIEAFMLAIEKDAEKELSIYKRSLKTSFESKPTNSVYNICSGISHSAREIVNLISKIKNVKISVKVNPNLLRKDESPNEYGSFKQARKELGWYPKVSLEDGLRKMLN